MALVDTLRQMTGVAAGDWPDERLQEVLDGQVSGRLVQLPAKLIRSVDGQGRTVWIHGQIPKFAGRLATDSVEIVDRQGQTVDGVTVEPDGRLTFTTDQKGRAPLVSGLAYDLNAAAADVCDALLATSSGDFDITVDGQTLKRSQRSQALAARAADFRAKALPKTVRLTRRPHNRTRRR